MSGDRSRRPTKPLGKDRVAATPAATAVPLLLLLMLLSLRHPGGEVCAAVVSRRAGSTSMRLRLIDREVDSGDDGDPFRTELAGLDTASRDILRCCHLVVGSSG